tara:strand:- start:336 stop:1076 length:741 start_codon:yes stop_codon:yes gene_type:complete
MPRYQVHIEYVGTKFIGWQIQKKGHSVQEVIQRKLSRVLKEKIILIGAGRTDSGVHAIEQSAHFDCKKKIKDYKKFLKSSNYFLNKELISILKIKKKRETFHARHSAKMRSYLYIIYNRESPTSLNKERGWHVKKKLNLNLMKKGAKKLTGTFNYSTFRSSSCGAKSPIRTIKNFTISNYKNNIKIRIESKSFLQQQVRSMVGCLKYLGEEKWSINYFEKVFKSKKRSLCAPPAPAMGLFLEKVTY